MKLRFIKILICLVYSGVLCSCRPKTISDPKVYLSYLADKSNGLSKEKTIAGITFKVKYLPAAYLAYNLIKEEAGISAGRKDSILRTYDNSVTFLLNIGPANGEAFDITRVGLNSYAEFAQRLEQMAFDAQNWISVGTDSAEQKPVIVRLENINALENSRNFIVVFNSEKDTKKDLRKTDLCFMYHDELFTTGTSKFIFKADDIQALPTFKF
jgi:hypothetical protein